MQTLTGIVVAFVVCCCLVFGVPVKRNAPPPSNTHICDQVYHGMCINTYEYKCMGLLIPGACNNMSNPNNVNFGESTQVQCCNGWKIDLIAQGGK